MGSRYNGNTEFFQKAARSTLHFGDIFSGVFKKHTKADWEKLFLAGTASSTPPESEMLAQWSKPWLFARVALVGIILSVLFYAMSFTMRASAACVLVGSFCLPLAILFFYWEMNIPRNVPMYEVLLMFLLGGVLSLGATWLLLLLGLMDGNTPACWAAFLEEPAKLLAVAVFLYKPGKKYILTGVLVGGAVGAGFAAMESAGYAVDIMNEVASIAGVDAQGRALQLQYALDLVLLRGILSPGGHVVWAALYGGTLAWAKNGEKLQPRHFTDWRFLASFGSAVALHFLWNYGISIVPIPVVGDLSYVLLTVAAWVILFFIIRQGVRQVLIVSCGAPQPAYAGQPVGASAPMLMGVKGYYAGQQIPLSSGAVVLGRDPQHCNLMFPREVPGVSRQHCRLEFSNGALWLSDLGSTCGTFLDDGRRLPPSTPVRLQSGQRFYLGDRNVLFEVRQ